MLTLLLCTKAIPKEKKEKKEERRLKEKVKRAAKSRWRRGGSRDSECQVKNFWSDRDTIHIPIETHSELLVRTPTY